jgi:hypothetical protein
LALFDVNQFEISTPHCSTHYSLAVSGDVLLIVVHQTIRLSDVIVSDILDSDSKPIVIHVLDNDRSRNRSEAILKFADLDGFQSFISEII